MPRSLSTTTIRFLQTHIFLIRLLLSQYTAKFLSHETTTAFANRKRERNRRRRKSTLKRFSIINEYTLHQNSSDVLRRASLIDRSYFANLS